MTEYLITLENINKEFYIGSIKKDGVLNRCLSFISDKEQKTVLPVLKNINLKVPKGEIFGIIGKNASGKSTLLRTIAGIYQPSSGEIKTTGDLIYLTGFGFGLIPKLTMKENIYLIGSLYGLNKKEINNKLEEIISFSELDKYLNTKIYQFSSGMINRLAFSVTVFCINHKNPDILLIDEALDAGADINFQNKAINKIGQMINSGATVILISHNMETIRKYCNQVVLLDNGEISEIGTAENIINQYLKRN